MSSLKEFGSVVGIGMLGNQDGDHMHCENLLAKI